MRVKFPMEEAVQNTDAVAAKIEEILDKVRPYVQMHGGDVVFVEAKDGTATLKLYGACVGCGLADLTYNKMIGSIIKKEIPEITKVTLL